MSRAGWVLWCVVAAATDGIGVGPAGAAVEAPPRIHEVAIEARTAAGAPARIAPAELEVVLAGDPIAVREAEPIAAGDWSVLVYVDALAAGGAELERAAAALGAASETLAALGPVTLIVADTLTEPWIEGSRDADELGDAFAELAAASFAPPDRRLSGFATSRRTLLLDTLARRFTVRGARALVVVGDANGERSTIGSPSDGSPERRGELAAAVAALGWVALPFHLVGDGGGVMISPLAEETGGEAVLEVDALDAALRRLAERRLLRLEVRTSDGSATASGRTGAIAPLSVRAPAGWTIRAPRWVATATPDFVLLARLHGLEADGESGDLEVAAAAALDAGPAGEPLVAVEVLTGVGGQSTRSAAGSAAPSTEPSASAARLRASFVLARLEEPPLVVHHRRAEAGAGDARRWLLQARLDAPTDLEQVAVVVEDLTTGRWGAAIAELDTDAIEVEPGVEVAVEVADLRAPRPRAASGAAAAEPPLIRLVPPRARDLTGVQSFRAMSLNAFIRRVVFFLDGHQVAEDGSDPFTARIDLGPEARQREVRAVAYDRAGRQLGEDTLVVNRPRTTFDVDIVEVREAPLEGRAARAGAPAPAARGGPIEVTTRVSVPPRRRVERVELYWNETLATTLTSPPWSATLDVEPSAGGDYVRAVATLDDGASLEDVYLVGVAGQGEKVEVNLVEIFAVVLDREGAPVRDLERGEVSVRLAGKKVELERFGVASDLPLDVGLVIDTSQSMEILMDDTRAAAVRFLADLVRPGDRAFLVDFDTKPRLAQGMTREMMKLVKALGSLRASGNTALYDSILFSLLHFEEGEDRRAVVLLTDGDDYQSRFSARQASLQARAAGVPVYMLSLAGMDWMRPAMRKTDLETIAKQTGGHVFYVSAREELAAAYARIGDELRSQYVLAFATERALTEAELAKIDVRVSRPDTTVRAVVAGRSIQTR